MSIMSIGRLPVLLVFLVWVLSPGGGALADEPLRERLEGLREARGPAVAGVSLSDSRVLDDFYRTRVYAFAWEGEARANDLAHLVEASRDDGLQPRDFHLEEIRTILDGRAPASLSGKTRVDVDILLTDSLLRLIHHYRYGKVDPQALDDKWNHAEAPYASDLMRDLERVVAAQDLTAELHGLMPRPKFYTGLRQGLARYREIAAAGGWRPVPPGRTLKPGMSDGRVPAARERLRVTGEFKGPDVQDPRRFDRSLKEAVMAFQKRHNLDVDGVIGPATLAAMNISAAERVDQIRVNLERMRWVSDGLPDDFLLVDVAGQQLDLIRDGRSVWHTRVIVGRPDRPTPVFRDQVEYLEVNPTWTVPPTILKKDILPNARKNPGYVSKKGLEVLTRSGRRVAPGSVNWNVAAGVFPYLLRQPAGNRNALGRIKFMFPNQFAVYLHDTPSRNLFEKSKRLFSSGCVRVEKPLELAELVLNDPEHWSQEKIAAAVGSKRTRWLHLKEPLPIILSYWTADADEDGQVRFREDVYQRDAQVLAALNSSGQLRLVYVQEPSAVPGASGESDTAAAIETNPPDEAEPEPRTSANGSPGDPPGLRL